MFPVLFFTLLLLVLLYFYLKRTYFTSRSKLSDLDPHLLYGNLIQSGILTSGISLAQALAVFKKRYGDTFQFWLGPSCFIVANDIAGVQHIFNNRNIYDQGEVFIQQASILFPDGLICTKGAKFKRHASVTVPLFRRGKITPNFDLIIDCVDKLLAKWRDRPDGQVHTDIVDQCQNL